MTEKIHISDSNYSNYEMLLSYKEQIMLKLLRMIWCNFKAILFGLNAAFAQSKRHNLSVYVYFNSDKNIFIPIKLSTERVRL